MTMTRSTVPLPAPKGYDRAKTRNFRVPEQLWADARTASEERGEYLATVITDALTEYADPKNDPAPVPKRGRPGVTKPVTTRVRDAAWDGAKARAEKRGERLSDVLVAALERYVNRR